MKLSIVIPVYGVEATLDRCVQSVLSQTYADYELLLVDDGSPDGCPALCDGYAQEDPRVRVVHKANGGLSSARNAGLDVACGDYITFVDSDDHLAPGTLGILMSRLGAHPEYDILEYPVCWHHGDPDERVLRFGAKTYHDMDVYWTEGRAYAHAYAWNKVYARRLFDGTRYAEGRLYEDAEILPRLLAKAHTVATTDEGMYYYHSTPGSITLAPDGRGLDQLLDTHAAQLKALGIDDQLTEYFAHVLNIQLDVYHHTRAPLRLATPSFSWSEVRRLDVNRKTKAKLRLLKLIGMKNLCRIHHLTLRKGRGH